MPDLNTVFNSVPNQRVHTQAAQVEAGLDEGIIERLPELSVDTPDNELVRNIDEAIQIAMPMHEDIKRVQDMNEDYWLGYQTRRRDTDSRTVRPIENRHFLSAETLIPIVTDRPPEPLVFAMDQDTELARSLEKVLVGKYQEHDVDQLFAMAVRMWMMNRLGVIKLVYDIESDDFKPVHVRPQRLVIANRGVTEEEVPYIGELVEDTYSDILEKFPHRKADINRVIALRSMQGEAIHKESPIKYWEFWTNEMVVWKYGPLILDKSVNPMYDFENPERNFVKDPFKPYFFLHRILSLGRTAYDDTTYSEQTKGIQDALNKANWAVTDDIADRGTMIFSGEGISKANAKKHRGGSNAKLWISKGKPGEVVDRLPPKQINPTVLAYTQGLANRSDDLWGTHGTTRGERGQAETATGRQLLKDSDTGRTAPVSRALHNLARKLYNAEVQLMKLYWGEERYVPYVNESGGLTELVKFSGQSIREGMMVAVRTGSMLPLDKFVQRNEALELASQGRIDPETLYEKLGWAKPHDAAKKLYIWQRVEAGQYPADVLFPGLTAEIGRAMQQSEQVSQRASVDPNAEDETQVSEDGLGAGGPPGPEQGNPAEPPGAGAPPDAAPVVQAIQEQLQV